MLHIKIIFHLLIIEFKKNYEENMSVQFEVIERVGISTESISDAVKAVLNTANNEKKVAWFEVVEQRGRITSDSKIEFQVKVKIGRKINE